MAAFASSCSIFLEAESEQCSTDADCTRRGQEFDRMYCAESKVCVPNDAYCKTNAECIQRNGGEHYICRQSEHRCIDLLSPDCPTLYMTAGDLANDGVVIFGALMSPTTSPGLRASDLVLELARSEIREAAGGGLPGVGANGKRRPVVFVSCTGEVRKPSMEASANHLVNRLKVPAIIGPFGSSDVLNVASKYTLPAKVLMLTPGGSSELVANIQNRGQLLYRYDMTTPTVTSANATLLRDHVEGLIRERKGLTAHDKIKVGFLYPGDGLGWATRDLLFERLWFNGRSAADNGDYYLPSDYGDPASTATFQATTAAAASNMAGKHPDVLILDGSAGSEQMFAAILREESRDANFKPFYILPEALSRSTAIPTQIKNDEMRLRVLGDMLGPSADDPTYKRYASLIRSSPLFKPTDPLPGPHVYDAAYMLHYAAAAVGSDPLTGENIGKAMQRLSPPADISLKLGVLGVPDAFNVLSTGGRVDFQGYRGPEDFDAKGDMKVDLLFWCVPQVGTPQRETGMMFSATNGTLVGTNNCFPKPPSFAP
ncbi:hypothetical protein [Pendulispora albinea]|uniref:ABC transporter substrate-binding protein n=1 Tax=Pendulispora albinea TaxID=2741071 RepID=A0ABZ2M225_9BACT